METREQLIEIISGAKTKLSNAEGTALADAIMDGLRKRGKTIADEGDLLGATDDHLHTLKKIRRMVTEKIEDPECSTRDLSSLTLRLEKVSQQITTIEERYRGEQRERGGNNGKQTAGATTSAESGSLDI